MTGRHLLHLTHAGLAARHWRDGTLGAPVHFAADADGVAAFGTWLARHPRTRLTLLVDLADESFHLETLPRLRGRDRHRLIARRQAQLHLDTPYVAQLTLARDAADPQHERLLFAALSRPAALQPWLHAVGQTGSVLTGVHSAAALGPALLPPPAPPARALLVTLGPAGLRLTCLDHGRLRFSRLVPGLTPGTDNLWAACHDEVQRTAHYLAGQRILARGAATPVLILAHPDQHAAIRAACPDSPDLCFTAVDLPALATRRGLRSPPADSDSLPLLLHLAATTRRQPDFAAPADRRRRSPVRPDSAIGIAAAALLSASLVLAANDFIDTRRLHRQADSIRAETRAEAERSTALAAAIPALPVPADVLRADIARLAALQRFSAGPTPFFHQLAAILERQPELRLQQLDWRISADTQQQIQIEVELPPAAAGAFIAALRQLPGATVDTAADPDGQTTLRPIASVAAADLPRLQVRATLPPPAP